MFFRLMTKGLTNRAMRSQDSTFEILFLAGKEALKGQFGKWTRVHPHGFQSVSQIGQIRARTFEAT